MKRFLIATVILAGMTQVLSAQALTRRAEISGNYNGRNGKCTIEVDVDGAAEVDVTGDMGRIRTISGQTAVWRRFLCNAPVPRNPTDFRFRGIDGRGDVRLIRDPRNAGGRAVVHIQDPKSGREGYTFDLEWSGGDNSGYNSGIDPFSNRNDPYTNRGNNPNRRNNRYDDPNYGSNNSSYGTPVRSCQDAAASRLNQEGYSNVRFQRVAAENNSGRQDRVAGVATANRNGISERLAFSCSVDFNTGRVRSLDMIPR
jgi:hypothetical protein